ncbi:hypothetical protein EMIT0P2_60203 [Pseudomonas sp. IT-P2]
MSLFRLIEDMLEPLSMSVDGVIPLHCERFPSGRLIGAAKSRQSGVFRQTMKTRTSH